MLRLSSLFTCASLAFVAVSASTAAECSPSVKCPESAPCCSAYGQCGAGAYCLGGCDPRSSHSLTSCMARPTCKSEDFTFHNIDGMLGNTVYLGDATNTNWVTEGQLRIYEEDSLVLTMPQSSVGSLVSSTHYVWYGKISATMRSSAGQGVVSAFIMMSDVKDEIDFEFVGSDLQAIQSNFYWQGVTNYTNSENLTVANTNTEWHTYSIDWQEDQLTWSIDDKIMRTLKKVDTLNETTGEYMYPQTPARIQLSLWPAGLPSNGKGTVDWAGGLINWQSPYMTSTGYYYALVKEVKVECAKPPSNADIQGTNSYQYSDYTGMQSSVEITDDSTILGSIFATGQNPDFNPDKKGSSQKPLPTNVPNVPGGSQGGARGGAGSTGTGSQISGTGSGDGSSSSIIPGSGGNTFTQGLESMAMQKAVMQGSAIAALVALGALVLV